MKRALMMLLACCGFAAQAEPDFSAADRIVEELRLDAHIPGMVYGVVIDGKLVHVAGFGVQDIVSNRPVTPDSLFRIASMTKAFTALTILQQRDLGRLSLDEPAEKYVPELQSWPYPTSDSPKIRVRDLLSHVAGFVTDDPWGDRQTPLPEADFTALLKAGVPFTRAPQTGFEYSNLGYALLGRIISNVSRKPFEESISRTLLEPLGMSSSGFVADAAPAERRSLGYRWEDDQWRPEPALGPGAFGAMGGLQTSARDYAKWVAFLLSAWPPRDGPELEPVKRSTVRELAQGLNFPALRKRPGRSGDEACRQAAAYGMGFYVAVDCDLGLTLSHGGGYPGFGSRVLLLPERGVGIFAFANRTYAGPSPAVWDVALALDKAGILPPPRSVQPGPALLDGYRAAGEIFRAGAIEAAGDRLAMNVLLDHDSRHWSQMLGKVRAESGDCDTGSPLSAEGSLSGSFTWTCAHGRVRGEIEMAPTSPPRLQSLELEPVKP